MDGSERLAGKLEALTEASIDRLSLILGLPLDVENGALLRAQTMAAAVAINAQLRADSLRLRAARADLALDRLIELMRAKEATVPCDVAPTPGADLAPALSMSCPDASAAGSMPV